MDFFSDFVLIEVDQLFPKDLQFETIFCLGRKQKLLNISIAQTISWVLNIVSCILCMFVTKTVIIPALVINCFARATIVAGSQAVVATL